MRVVFLDFDGTMNGLETHEPPSPIHKGIFLNPVLVERVNRICEATGAKVVLSTKWRDREDRYPKGHEKYVSFEGVITALQLVGARFEVVGKTPNLTRSDTITRDGDTTVLERHRPRHMEIAAWVAEHKPEAFVILDDDRRAEIAGHFVWCDPKRGLSEEGAREAIRILGVQTLHPSPASGA